MRSAISPQPKLRSFLQGITLSLVAVVLFFGLLEGGLSLFGVEPRLRTEDPFVGFAANIPLFVEQVDPDGRKIMVTAKNKTTIFNPQQFPLEKAPGTRRIFCLGGSTTYGHPYKDPTSFPGWLRELLPEADPGQRWEVINAGGVSYASYREAQLMQELARYQPDLFIIFTGHNEFLEERSYGALRDIPGPVKTSAALLARTRTWAAMSTALDRVGALPRPRQSGRVQLTAEVNAILDRSIGPESYRRDDRLREQILLHYRISLERMADIARSAGAEILLVTPVANLRDCSPFKSEHTSGLDPAAQRRSEESLTGALEAMGQERWSEALALLDQAVAIDPGHAELHYRRGKCLLALGRHGEADEALRRARDEDVCPLRALTEMAAIVKEVAREKDTLLVDFDELLGRRVRAEQGLRSPGEDYFLDHVHPTIAGNRMLAVALVEALAEHGLVRPVMAWGEQMIERVATRVEGGLDRKEHVRALLNLGLVLNWAGKQEEADRLVRRVMDSGIEDEGMLIDATAITAPHLLKRGDYEGAARYYRQALLQVPASGDLHLLFGLMYMKIPSPDWDKAGAHALLATAFLPRNDIGFLAFGDAMARRQRYDLAFHSFTHVLRINPQNPLARAKLERLRGGVRPERQRLPVARITFEKYASGAPRQVVQVRADATGRPVPDGIWSEWYENGMVKKIADYEDGVQHGVEVRWTPDGQVAQRVRYQHGKISP